MAALVVVGVPIAYWIAFSRWRWKPLVEAVVALPLVLPPTVLGFYILMAIGPRSPWKARIGLRSVAAEPFIIIARSRSASFYDHALSVCAATGFAPRIVQEANELFTILSLVGAGLGVSLVPRSAALMQLPGVRFRKLTLPEAAWHIGVAWHRDAGTVPLVQRFVEMVQAARLAPGKRRFAPRRHAE